MRRWRVAMERALYGPDGFFRRPGGPAGHFRTSAHTGALFGTAIARLVDRVDGALGRPEWLDIVDIGAGGGELLTALLPAVAPGVRARLRPLAVEVAPRPEGLDPRIGWRPDPPDAITGLLLATEWLDNIPLDIAEWIDGTDGDGRWRYVLVDDSGMESTGGELSPTDVAWLRRWWPAGVRAEIGRSRDTAWAGAVARLSAGLALAVDYGHLRDARPPLGTLTGFRDGREVPPVPDGSSDLTAHIAADAVAAAGSAVAGLPSQLVRQAAALRDLGVDGGRPPIALAHTDPAGYVRALAAASTAAELTDPTGLGDHFWLVQPVGAGTAALRIAG